MRLTIDPANPYGATLRIGVVLTGLLGCMGIAGCGARLAHPVSPSVTGLVIPGTYRVEICRGACDDAGGGGWLAKGTLVIEASTYPTTALPAAVREYLEFTSYLLAGPDRDLDPNACFTLRQKAGEETYAGLEPVGFTVVEPFERDQLLVVLFRSPDASYDVVLQRQGSDFRGSGHSSGIGDAAVSLPDDSVYARRTGPPDRRLCIRAAEAAAAELEARRNPPRP